jgi:hypothetical protein
LNGRADKRELRDVKQQDQAADKKQKLGRKMHSISFEKVLLGNSCL